MKSVSSPLRFAACCSLLLLLLWSVPGCRKREPYSIAVIPRTTGTLLWEPENVGAQTAASELGEQIYWNAPAREDDIDGQIALVDRVRSERHRGLVLAPDHSLALTTPVRRAVESGLPIVILGSPLAMPATAGLTYVLNDETAGGRLAAERAATVLNGAGEVALVGIDLDITGILDRANSFERDLAEFHPEMRIVVQRPGTFNFAHEQASAEEVLREHPGLNLIVALTSTATRGVLSAIETARRTGSVKVIGFDPDSLPFENPSLDAIVAQNTRRMGECAVRLIHAQLAGQPFPARTMFEPMLVTRENLSDPTVQALFFSRWIPGAAHLERTAIQ